MTPSRSELLPGGGTGDLPPRGQKGNGLPRGEASADPSRPSHGSPESLSTEGRGDGDLPYSTGNATQRSGKEPGAQISR